MTRSASAAMACEGSGKAAAQRPAPFAGGLKDDAANLDLCDGALELATALGGVGEPEMLT